MTKCSENGAAIRGHGACIGAGPIRVLVCAKEASTKGCGTRTVRVDEVYG